MGYEKFANPPGSYQWQPSKPGKDPSISAVQSYLYTPTPTSLDKAAIAKRMAVIKVLFYKAKPLLPDHPAVNLVENFINHKLYPVNISDKETLTEDGSAYLYDLRRMPEVQNASIEILKKGNAISKGQTVDFSRHLGDQSFFQQLTYPGDIVGDIYGNTTRALLGSFNGKATISEIGADKVLITFKVNNPLTWESLTRLPPILGGYEGGNSYVPDIPGWSIETDFKWREIISC